jgi:predicted DNA-binding protein
MGDRKLVSLSLPLEVIRLLESLSDARHMSKSGYVSYIIQEKHEESN